MRWVGLGTGKGAFTLELRGKGSGVGADRNHRLLSRSKAPNQEDNDSIRGNTYHDKTYRRQGRKVMQQVGNEAVG